MHGHWKSKYVPHNVEKGEVFFKDAYLVFLYLFYVFAINVFTLAFILRENSYA